MNNKPEMSANITAEIRARAGAMPSSALTKYEMTLADRIDAAVKRECIEAATRAATQGVKLTNEKHANMPIGNTAAMHDALVAVKKLFDGRLMFQPAIRTAHEAVNAALSAPPRNCDVNTLGSLSYFVEKAILTSDLLKDTHEIVKRIVVACVRTALTIAYEPAKRK